MNKIILSSLAAFALAGSAQAQNYNYGGTLEQFADNGISIMTYGGMTISNMRTADLPFANFDPKVGFTLGARMEYILPQCYGVFVNGSLEYSMKGARDRIEGLGGPGADWIARPMYVSLPIHVGYRYDVLNNLGLYADFGPYFAVGTNGKTRLKYDDFSADDTWQFFRNDDNGAFYETNRFDFGLGFRVGAEYAKHYNFIFACDWGITDMLTQDQKHVIAANPLYKNPALKNFNAAITFGYRF